MSSAFSPDSKAVHSQASLDSPSLARMLKLAVGLLLLIGVVSRISPLFNFETRLFWQHMTEDGYLMQTIARNMAIGLGMSTAEGTLPTNGVQPLATFLFAGLHFLAGGSKVGGIALVMAFSALVALATVYTSFQLGLKLFSGFKHGHGLALIAAALWFVGPRITAHSMNGLETGLYHLFITATWNYYLGLAQRDTAFTTGQRITFGLLLGLTFLARNDAVFFIAALLLAHWVIGGAPANGGMKHRFVDGIVAGFTSMVVASPWLIHNRVRFGSIVPISGSAQSFDATVGGNLPKLPANLFEAAYPHFPVPHSIESSVGVVVLTLLLTSVSVVGFWFFAARLSLNAKRFFVGGLLFSAFISIYYGVFFGAPHFLSRYTSSISPFLWLCTVATVFGVLTHVFTKPRGFALASGALVGLLTVSALFFAGLNYARGTTHQHKQVIDWVQANVAPDQWVGAPQTGTLGFFHDRTLNLDGKVNPEVLRVLLRDKHMLNYVVDSKINYIVDWVLMADWVQRKDLSPRFANEFEVVVRDPDLNLGVLRRIHPVSAN
jgi:hypothetical protein